MTTRLTLVVLDDRPPVRATWCGTEPFFRAFQGDTNGLSKEAIQAAEAFKLISEKWGR